MLRKLVLPLMAVFMLGFAVYHVVLAQQSKPKLEPPVQPSRSPFGKGVAGAGLIEPRYENIAVGTNLPGIVTKVFVKVRQEVVVGQSLFVLDDRALKREWQIRKASLDAAKAQLGKLEQMPRPEEVPAMEAKLREAEANLVDQNDQLARARRMRSQRAIGEEDVVRREQATSVSREQVRRAEADLTLMKKGAWKPDLQISSASVDQARAMLDQTEMELERLTVRALSAGQVLQVNVRPGEYVNTQASTALIVLGNLEQLHVRVDIDEHDIPRFDEKAKAKGTLRGDPSQGFDLECVRVEPYVIPKKSLTGDNTERVDTRVLQVIYAVKGSKRPLFVGQQVDVFIDGSSAKK